MIGVTSFSREGYEKYGHNFLKSIDHWPGKIIAYLESPIDFEHPKLEKRDFFSIPDASVFLENIGTDERFKGIINGQYDYNFDVWKFCRKMFCQFDAFKEGGKVFWLDGDTEIIKPISEKYLENIFKGQHLVVFGREGFYSETGFVGFDVDHPDFEEFEQRYISSLQNGIFYTLKGWHDCYCLDWARDGKGHDLTKGWKKGDSLHVIPKSDLGKYLIHRKGKRKKEIK
jgi:hypothetical protein